MTIYVDTLFVLNLIINYLLLLGTAKITGAVFKRLRLLAGAIIGAVYSVAVFLPDTGFLLTFGVKFIMAVIIIFTSFKYTGLKPLIRLTLTFFGVSFILGGGVYAMYFFTNSPVLKNGMPYVHINLRILLLSSAVCYALVSLIFKRRGKVSGSEIVTVKISFGGKTTSFRALVDTGNTLNDPFTGETVIITELNSIKPILPSYLLPSLNDLKNPVKALSLLSVFDEAKAFRLIPYTAVGVNNGLLLSFKPEAVYIGENIKPELLIALSPTPISDGTEYTALAGI